MCGRTGCQGQIGSGSLPSWLYPVSVAWGGCVGVVFYACGRFEYWFTYGLATLDERPAFWDAWAVVCFLLVAALSAAYFAFALRRACPGRALVKDYVVAAVALPLLLWTVGVVFWTLSLSQPTVVGGLLLWLVFALPVSPCLAPVGLVSGVAFSVLAARSRRAESSRQG